jgi:hypothetical protein
MEIKNQLLVRSAEFSSSRPSAEQAIERIDLFSVVVP